MSEEPVILGYDSGVEEGKRRTTARIVKLLREYPALSPGGIFVRNELADLIERETP